MHQKTLIPASNPNRPQKLDLFPNYGVIAPRSFRHIPEYAPSVTRHMPCTSKKPLRFTLIFTKYGIIAPRSFRHIPEYAPSVTRHMPCTSKKSLRFTLIFTKYGIIASLSFSYIPKYAPSIVLSLPSKKHLRPVYSNYTRHQNFSKWIICLIIRPVKQKEGFFKPPLCCRNAMSYKQAFL